MRFVDNDMRIINPYIRVVWIVAVGNELKVANPDNAAPLKNTRFFRICNL